MHESPEQEVESLLVKLDDKNWESRLKAAQALGHHKDPRAVEPLIRILRNSAADDEDEDAVAVRFEALKSLGEIGGARVCEALMEILDEILGRPVLVYDPFAWNINDILGQICDARAVRPLIRAIQHEDIDTRISARRALVNIGEPAVLPLINLLRESPSMQVMAALGQIGDRRALEPLSEVLADTSFDELNRASAAVALGELRSSQSFDLLLNTLNNPAERNHVRRSSAVGLGMLGEPRALEPLRQYLGHDDWPMQHDAARALGYLKDARAVESLIPLISHDRDEVCITAIWALGQIGDERALPALSLPETDTKLRFHSDHIQHTRTEAIKNIQAGKETGRVASS